jgi:hypothetical protein
MLERVNGGDVATGPRQKVNLVNGSDHSTYIRPSAQILSRRMNIAAKPRHERRSEDVEIVRPAEMKQVQ